MSPSKSTNDRSCDGSQDRKVDRLDMKTTFPRWVWAIPFLLASGSIPTRSTWLGQSSPEGQVAGQAGWDHSCQGAWWSAKITQLTIWGVVVNQNNSQNKFGKNWKSNLLPAERLGGAVGPSADWIRTGGGGGGGWRACLVRPRVVWESGGLHIFRYVSLRTYSSN